MKSILIIFCFFVLPIFRLSAQYPVNVQHALAQTKNNKQQLRDVLNYFYKSGDPLKIKSANFLIANMPLHYSQSYYWADSLGNKVAFDELRFKSFDESVEALNNLKHLYPKLHPVSFRYRDIDSMRAADLIENIQIAVNKYRKKKGILNISENDFLEYILPYRISVEPYQKWRIIYAKEFSNVLSDKNICIAELSAFRKTIDARFKNIYGLERRTEPLPRLGALQILERGKGLCEDIADMVTFIARSQGIAATVDNIPEWGTSTGDHFLNYLCYGPKHPHFDFDRVVDTVLGREPAKVVRTTYSAQKDAVANWIDTFRIPPGFLRIKNYKDVTKEYWPTEDITVDLFNPVSSKSQIVYAYVFNSGRWQPVWYGVKHGRTALFRQMGKGVVYLPMYYEDGIASPATWPYALGYNNAVLLKPDLSRKRSIVLKEQDKYLRYRPGKKYRLFYWNNKWQMIGEQIAPQPCVQLEFAGVPSNALLLMVPEYSQGKERPFIILNNGERIWW